MRNSLDQEIDRLKLSNKLHLRKERRKSPLYQPDVTMICLEFVSFGAVALHNFKKQLLFVGGRRKAQGKQFFCSWERLGNSEFP